MYRIKLGALLTIMATLFMVPNVVPAQSGGASQASTASVSDYAYPAYYEVWYRLNSAQRWRSAGRGLSF